MDVEGMVYPLLKRKGLASVRDNEISGGENSGRRAPMLHTIYHSSIKPTVLTGAQSTTTTPTIGPGRKLIENGSDCTLTFMDPAQNVT